MTSYSSSNTNRIALALGAGIVASMLLAGAASADVVHLKNGDRVTGDIIKFDGTDLLIDPDIADDITIGIDDIESIETSQQVTIEYDDMSEATGYIVVGPDGKMRIVAKPPAMPQEQPAAVVDVEVEEVDVEITAPDGQPEVVVDVEEVDVWAEEAVDDRAPEIGEEVVLSDIHLLEETQTYFNYKAAVDFGLNIAKGNTDSGNINLSAMVAPSWGKNTITIDGQMNKGQSDGDNTISNWRIKGIYEREVYRRWFFGVINAWQQDSFQDLNLRLTAGAGVAHTVFDEPRLFGESTFLKVGLFPAVVNENFRGSDDDDTYAALVWKLDSSQDLYTDDINFYHNHQLTIGLSKSAAIWLTTTGFKFDLIDDFALLLEFQYDLNTEPANDAKKSDYRYLVKLAYDFEGNQRDWFH